MGGWGRKGGVYGLAGRLGLCLRFVQGQTIHLRLGRRFLQGQSVQLQRLSRGFVLRRHATSTEGCSVGMKCWRTIMMIAL